MNKDYYTSSIEHILAELERVDVMIRAHVYRARQIQKVDSEFQGLYISEQEVDTLLDHKAGRPRWASEPATLSLAEIRSVLDQMSVAIFERKTKSQLQGITLRLDRLTQLFGLEQFEIDALLICLAPEFDLRYERLYAYLQDDVTKKRPSVDLVLNLLSPSFEAKLAARKYFAASASLCKNYLLHLFVDPAHPSPPLLGKYIKVNNRVVNYLCGADELDEALVAHTRIHLPGRRLEDLVLPEEIKRRLRRLAKKKAIHDQGLILYLQGPYGVGKQTTAEAVCHQLGLKLLVVKIDNLLKEKQVQFEKAVRLAIREALLQNAALYWQDFDSVLVEENKPILEVFMHEMHAASGLTFLSGESLWEPAQPLTSKPFLRVEFLLPKHARRVDLWKRACNGSKFLGSGVDLKELANKFRFSGGQIRDAVATARNIARCHDSEKNRITMADLEVACRVHSNRKLVQLAQKITPYFTWDDIVLPEDRRQQLREICNFVKYRSLVYEQWGFDQKLSLGKGLNVLFAGPSGTGKTMAAEIMAGELGLDLYKIDLSTVVSKYIGETEKNLARIFAEAQTSNAILFFDEADALFGKRSEVHDSHDRYANIEISYLLQKMEEYEGIAILATNLHRNMDDAFVRRMVFTVHFPIPEQADRLRIWQQIWPLQTPQSDDLDLPFISKQFRLAGGNIKNIACSFFGGRRWSGGGHESSHMGYETRVSKDGKRLCRARFWSLFSID